MDQSASARGNHSGTAVGSIAKHVAKNIDEEHVADDLEGRHATERAKRVET